MTQNQIVAFLSANAETILTFCEGFALGTLWILIAFCALRWLIQQDLTLTTYSAELIKGELNHIEQHPDHDADAYETRQLIRELKQVWAREHKLTLAMIWLRTATKILWVFMILACVVGLAMKYGF